MEEQVEKLNERVEELFKQHIYQWVKDNFGQSEADDPSWSIDALAHGLAYGSHSVLKYDIYRAVERDYLREDCKMIAEQNDIKLTDAEVELVVDEFENTEAYVDAHAEDWLYWIKQIKKGE